MPVLTLAQSERAALAAALRDPQRVVVVALCAAWCDTCNQFRAALERIADARREMAFVWVDIEDDSEVCGDVDVENFPTLAVYRGTTPIHFGVSLPHEATVARLVDALKARPVPLAGAPDAVVALPAAMAGG
jgi:thioredoxin